MDVMMPEMDGYETMRAIRKDPSHKSLPIIAITAKALKEDRDRCIQAGASDYLPKPVENDTLMELIRLCGRGQRCPAGTPPPRPSTQTPPASGTLWAPPSPLTES